MAGGGGAWKVAYADFVTAMMAFFMVMWLINMKPAVAPGIQEYFNDPWARYKTNSRTARNPNLVGKEGQEKPKKKYAGSNPKSEPHNDPESPKSNKPRVTTVREAVRSTEGTIAYFMIGSSELTDESKKKLELLIPRIKGLPQKIQIKGHTSMEAASTNVQESDAALDLCYRRSRVVRNFLREAGIPEDRMLLSQAGPHEGLSVDKAVEGNDKNARVEVFLIAENTEQSKGTSKERAKMEFKDEKAAEEFLGEHGTKGGAEPKKGGH